MKEYFWKYGGIFIGGIYGLLMRMIIGTGLWSFNIADLFSVTFVLIVPLIVGLTPLIFTPARFLTDYGQRIFMPILSVLAFLLLCFWSGHEDIICILIISIPYFIAAGISGIIFGGLVLHHRRRKGITYSIFLLPFISAFIEPLFPTPTEQVQTQSSIRIHSDKATIWNNIIRVDSIREKEYNKGFFNYAGIPRPLYAELKADTLGGLRIGHFEGGLTFRENIIQWDKDNSVTFDIKIIPSASNRTIFERHMLDGRHFKFLNATYSLKVINPGLTELQLTTTYQLDTKINLYGKLWGEKLLSDFQDRLICVIKGRCER